MDLKSEERGFVCELILPKDEADGEWCEDDRQNDVHHRASRGSPILGRCFKLPELGKSYDPDPPQLDDSLPYIPVYAHLKTFELAPIERPITPPLINKLRSSAPAQSKNPTGWTSAPLVTGSAEETTSQALQTVPTDSPNFLKCNSFEETTQKDSI